MKKTDVYVVVDTPKKAKKLKKVLDIFGENHTGEAIGDDYYNGVKLFDDTWCAIKTEIEVDNEAEVSIKELRNILAKEHLKAGDVCLFDDRKGFKSIGVFDEYSEEYTDFLVSKVPGKDSVRYGFHDFIRYATEEEKALLEPKSELEVGKWYVFSWYHDPNDVIGVYLIDKINNDEVWFKYGVNIACNYWSERDWYSKTHNWRLATPQEVEQTLVEEARRRGLVEGVHINSHWIGVNGSSFPLGSTYRYCNDELWVEGGFVSYTIFKNGKWATVIEQDKLSRLKEAFSKGYCVEFYDKKTDTWKRHENPCWNPDLQWRIMVNNGHLVVRDVYLLNQIKELKKSIEEIKSNIK